MSLKQFLCEAENKLVVYVLYILVLIAVLFFGGGIKGVLLVHLFAVLIISFVYFGKQFLFNLFFPFLTVYLLVDYFRLLKYIKKFPQNIHKNTVVILGHSNWSKLEAWIKPNYSLSEIKLLVKLLVKKSAEFSIYANAKQNDVRDIMIDSNVREVYFYGHGTSHAFQLCTDDILYYCDFNDAKYEKDFVHQFHCGTVHGKSLVDYVVGDENRPKCFLIRKPINSLATARELKKRIGDIKG